MAAIETPHDQPHTRRGGVARFNTAPPPRYMDSVIDAAVLHHPHPEHLPVADVDIVFAHKIERAVGADAK